jgi:NADPH:quinone reductase
MRAILAKGGCGLDAPDAFREAELKDPTPGSRDLLVRVAAAGLNPVDGKVRRNQLAPGQEKILGWDACGQVLEVGAEVVGFRPGDRVYYAGELGRDGCNAEMQLVDAHIAASAPAKLDDAQAAALPLTGITAWEGLFVRMGFPAEPGGCAGKTLLVVGGAGGVASMAIQLGRWAGFLVVATASRPDTEAWVTDLGASAVLDHRNNLADELTAQGLAAPEAVFCTTHLEKHWPALAQAIAPQGALCIIDDPTSPVDLTLFKRKCIRICWEFMFARALFKTPDLADQGAILRQIAALVEEGQVKSTLAQTIPGLSVENLREAHRRQDSGAMMGKQVILL